MFLIEFRMIINEHKLQLLKEYSWHQRLRISAFLDVTSHKSVVLSTKKQGTQVIYSFVPVNK